MADSKIYKPGDIVLDNCQPIVCQVFMPFPKGEVDKRCHYCFKECDNLKQCAQCHQVEYCSKECQKADWDDIHKLKECKLFRITGEYMFIPEELNHFSRLFVRLVCKVTFDPECRQKVYTLWNGRKRRLDDLMSHQDKFDIYAEQAITVEGLKTFMRKLFGVTLTKEQLVRWTGMCTINRHPITDPITNKEIGFGLYVDGSAFNHDCKPSCALRFVGRTMQVRAMRTIDTAKEEPTIDYLGDLSVQRSISEDDRGLAMDRDTRRDYLSRKYFFDCQCKRCTQFTDRDFEFQRYKSLRDNEPNDCHDIDYWDERIEMERQLHRQSNPSITHHLVVKFHLLYETYHRKQYQTLLKKCRDSAKELESEILITHGRQHPLYQQLMPKLRSVYQLAAESRI